MKVGSEDEPAHFQTNITKCHAYVLGITKIFLKNIYRTMVSGCLLFEKLYFNAGPEFENVQCCIA